MSFIHESAARAQAEHRIVRARERAKAAPTRHPPSLVRRGLATAVARVARKLDAETARRTLAVK